MMQKKKIRISLYIIIPLIFAGISVINILVIYRVIAGWAVVNEKVLPNVILWGGMLSLFSFLSAFLIVWTILKPVKDFVRTTESLNLLHPSSEEKKKEGEHKDEVQRYSEVFSQVTNLLSKVDARELFPGIMARVEPCATSSRQILKVAPTDSTVMITGESGTGKELVATAIFEQASAAISHL